MLLSLALLLIVIVSTAMLWHQFSSEALASSEAQDDPTAPCEAGPDIAKAA